MVSYLLMLRSELNRAGVESCHITANIYKLSKHLSLQPPPVLSDYVIGLRPRPQLLINSTGQHP